MTETIKTTAERPLRRRDRQLTEDEALQIVRHAPHAVLSTADAAGVPYGVPVNRLRRRQRLLARDIHEKPQGRQH